MALEAWTLDGVALTTGSSFLMMELTADPPKARAEWITAADSEGSDLLRDPQHENREITMKLRVVPQASMNVALDQIGAIRDKLRKAGRSDDGIPLVWTPHESTRSVTFDVLYGEITELPIGFDGQAGQWLKARPIFTVVLTCKPYWKGTETLTSTASSSTPLTTLEITGVTGDIPALGRLIVTDTATQSRRYVAWGLEGRNYQASTSLIVDSDSMANVSGSQATTTGAYDTIGGGNNSISAVIGPLPIRICSTGNLSHIGTFRVSARVYYFTGTYPEVYVGLDWQVAGGEVASNALTSVKSGGWRMVDLGVITIPTTASGTQQWKGTIRAQTGPSGVFGDTFVVDFLELMPVDEGYGKARGVFQEASGTVSGRDNYTGTTPLGVLNGRAAPTGGTWATSGATNDHRFQEIQAGLVFPAVEEVIEYYNGGTPDAGFRYAILGATNYTNVSVRTSFTALNWVAGMRFAVIARWTNSSNFVYMEYVGGATQAIKQVVAGATTTLASRTSYLSTNTYWDNMSLTIYASGRVIGELLNPDGSPYGARLEASSSALATGGTLATGLPGFAGRNATDGNSLFFDNFYVTVPTNPEPIAMYSGQTIEFRHNDTLREDSTGVYYGRPSSYRGSRFLVPPGTSRVAVRGRRNDADVDIDGGVTDATQIQVGWTPRGLVIPR